MVVTPLRNSKIGLGFGKSNSSKMRGGAGAFAARSRAVSKNQKPRLGVRRSFLGEAKQLGDRPASGVCRWKSKKSSKQQRRPGGVCSPGGVAAETGYAIPQHSCVRAARKKFNGPLGSRRVFSANREPEPGSRMALRLCGPAITPAPPPPRRR